MHTQHSSRDIHQTVVALADAGRDFVLASVLKADGSTPCQAGSKAIMDAEGVIQGTIGGGWVEVESQRRVAEVMSMGRPVVLDFDLESPVLADDHPVCGGTVRILMDPTAKVNREVYETASAIRRDRQRGVLLTTVRGQQEWNVTVQYLAAGAIPPDLGFPGAEAVRSALKREEPSLFVSESTPERQRLEVLVEPVIPEPLLLIVGGGHVGQAVASQASLVGFDIVVIDDRPEFTRPERFPDGTTTRCGEIAEQVACSPFGRDTYVVIATRGHKHDLDALAACLHKPVAYIGMIGSQRKVAMARQGFVESGRATSEEFDRIYAPIGLDIGSVTVPEIAASIVAQLIAVRRAGTSPRIPAK